MTDTLGGVRSARRQGLVVLAALAGFVGLVAVMAPLGGAVIAQGRLRPDGERIAIKHQEGGVVRRLAVEEGRVVAAGEVLVELDPTQLRAEIDILADRQLRLRFEAARLRAEEALAQSPLPDPPAAGRGQMIAAADVAVFPAELVELAGRSPIAGQVMKLQEETFAAKRATLAAELGGIAQTIAMADHDGKGLDRQAAALVDRSVLTESEHRDLAPLVEKGYLPRRRILDLQRSAAELRGELAEIEARRAAAEDRLRQARHEADRLRERLRNEALRELGRAQLELAEVGQRLTAAHERASRLVVRAPHAGQVVELALTSPGDVVAPGGQLLELVPNDREYTVVARVDPGDVEQLGAEQEVEVRLSAYDNRRFAPVPGRIRHVARDSIADPKTGQHYFPVHVRFTGDLPAGASSGMPAEVYFKTAERSLATYLLGPLLNSMDRSLREP